MNIKLNNSQEMAIIDDDDFMKVSVTNWFVFAKKKNKRKLYVKSTGWIDKKQRTLHRYILGITDPKICVDHINGNPFDNRRQNLRVCSISENNRNKTTHANSSSKYLGVSFDKSKNKWVAELCYNRKKVYRKRFKTETEAALAYNVEALKYFGEFANLNKVIK